MEFQLTEKLENHQNLIELLENIHLLDGFTSCCKSYLLLAQMMKSEACFQELKSNNFERVCHLLEMKDDDTNVLLFCKVLFVCVITRHQFNISEAKNIEQLLFTFFVTLNKVHAHENSCAEHLYDVPLQMLPETIRDSCLQLCEDVLEHSNAFDITQVNVSFLCFKALENICRQVSDFLEPHIFSSCTIFEVLEKFHSLMMSPTFSMLFNLSGASDCSYDFKIATVHSCLQSLEIVLLQNPENQDRILNYKNNLFLRCICRLLAYCMKSLFKEGCINVESADDVNFEKMTSVVSKFVHLHQTCLLSALKLLLNVHLSRDTQMCNVAVILMERLLICFLETSYSSVECRFELCLMTLEMMVNLVEFELVDRKQFAKLCLMKFSVGKYTYLSVEILIKVLTGCLKRILTLGSFKKKHEKDLALSPNVYHVAEEHMEHSFICSYICVFLSYFCYVKKPFFVYVQDRLPAEMAEAAVLVMNKFKGFIPVMKKQNTHAFNMLDRAIFVFLQMTKQQK